jgi:hypothetical protein
MNINSQVIEATNQEESNQLDQGPGSFGRGTSQDERRSSSPETIDSLDDLSDVQALRRIVRANYGFIEGNGPFTQFGDELRFVSPHSVRSPSTLSNSGSWSRSHRPYSRTEFITGIARAVCARYHFRRPGPERAAEETGSHAQRPVFIIIGLQWSRHGTERTVFICQTRPLGLLEYMVGSHSPQRLASYFQLEGLHCVQTLPSTRPHLKCLGR